MRRASADCTASMLDEADGGAESMRRSRSKGGGAGCSDWMRTGKNVAWGEPGIGPTPFAVVTDGSVMLETQSDSRRWL